MTSCHGKYVKGCVVQPAAKTSLPTPQSGNLSPATSYALPPKHSNASSLPFSLPARAATILPPPVSKLAFIQATLARHMFLDGQARYSQRNVNAAACCPSRCRINEWHREGISLCATVQRGWLDGCQWGLVSCPKCH
jgi:hypothetical protein